MVKLYGSGVYLLGGSELVTEEEFAARTGAPGGSRKAGQGTMAMGEGGDELAKQLLRRTYDFARPQVIAIYLTGAPKPGVGSQDVALSIIGAVYKSGYVKNKVMEFVGPGIAGLSAEYRNAIDVMTTETTCWSSIWVTDKWIRRYFTLHGRPDAYKELRPADVTWYDGCVYVDLSTVECTIAMPMHPSNVYTIHELQENAQDILHLVQEEANRQIKGAKMELDSKYHDGAVWVEQGEIAGCVGGRLTAANDIEVEYTAPDYHFDQGVYQKRVYNGWGRPEPEHALRFGPNIKDWPEFPALTDDLLVKVCSYITDPVTTIFANMPGDGSAREQAASCQRVVGAAANLSRQYATKRYRSNCINWGMVPFLVEDLSVFALDDYIFVPGIRQKVLENADSIQAYAVSAEGRVTAFTVSAGPLTGPERDIIANGCLINYYRNNK